MKQILFILLFAALVFAAPTHVCNPAAGGSISLDGNVNAAGNTSGCFIFTANTLTLDCNGYTIYGTGAEIGIYSQYRATTVKECVFRDLSVPVYFRANTENIVQDTVIYNAVDGIWLRNFNATTISNTTIYNTTRGISINLISNSNTIYNTTIFGNDRGILLNSASKTNVSYNNISYNTNYSIVLEGSSNTSNIQNNTITSAKGISISASSATVYRNVFIDGSTAFVSNDIADNQFNTTDHGFAAGNYYADILNYDIIDANRDGYGDSGSQYPYNSTVSSKWIGLGNDYGPITTKDISAYMSITLMFPTNQSLSSNVTNNFIFYPILYNNASVTNYANCSIWTNQSGSFTLNNTNTTTIINTTNNTINITGLSDGTISWYIKCYDNAGDVYNSEIRELTIDITNPIGNYISPTPYDGKIYSDSNFTANVSVTEVNLNNAILVFDGLNKTMNCTGVSPNYDCNYTVVGLPNGVFKYQVYINDLSGRYYALSERWFGITDLYTNIISPLPTTYSTENITTSFNISVYNTANCSRFLDGVRFDYDLLSTGIYSDLLTYLGDGPHTYNLTCVNDTVWNSSEVAFTITSGCKTIHANHIMMGDINSTGDCFILDADNIVLDCNNYTINGDTKSSGVINKKENNTVKNCIIQNFTYGIYSYSIGSNNLKIFNNTIWNNTDGIILDRSNYSNASYNNISYNTEDGIRLNQSIYNNISYNNIQYNGITSFNGISFSDHSDNSLFYNNIIKYSYNGISLHNVRGNNISTNDISFNSRYGCLLDTDTEANYIYNNHIYNNIDNGVYLVGDTVDDNYILNNIITGNKRGIYVSAGDNNKIGYNTISSNTEIGIMFGSSTTGSSMYNNSISQVYGMSLSFASISNTIYYNQFYIGTGYYIKCDNALNEFNTTVGGVPQGNYYADITSYSIFDSNHDGFGDIGADYPYNSSEVKWQGFGNDYGPMMAMYSCIGGVPYLTCSAIRPKYCTNTGVLIDNCTACGCFAGYHCGVGNICYADLGTPIFSNTDEVFGPLYNSVLWGLIIIFSIVFLMVVSKKMLEMMNGEDVF